MFQLIQFQASINNDRPDLLILHDEGPMQILSNLTKDQESLFLIKTRKNNLKQGEPDGKKGGEFRKEEMQTIITNQERN